MEYILKSQQSFAGAVSVDIDNCEPMTAYGLWLIADSLKLEMDYGSESFALLVEHPRLSDAQMDIVNDYVAKAKAIHSPV